MYTKRIIPCLDVKNGRVVKGTNFVGLRDAGDPVELAKRYDTERCDELVFLDITASNEERDTIVQVARDCASQVFIPFTIGGGIRTPDDMRKMLKAGADKTSVNTAAVKNPDIIKYVGEHKKKKIVVGFALESKNLLSYAKTKLKEKNLDMIVANGVNTISSKNSSATLVFKDGKIKSLKLMTKEKVAKEIINESIRIYKTLKTC